MNKATLILCAGLLAASGGAVWGAGPAPGESTYLVPVKIPAYNPANPEHCLITTNNNGWSKINDPDHRFFYVEPGDYRSLGNIVITRSGTGKAPRTISLHNGNDLHPGKLPRAEQANVVLDFKNTSHWVVDRMSSFDRGNPLVDVYSAGSSSFRVHPVCSHIVFSRLYLHDFGVGFWLWSGLSNETFTRNITIQNSRFDGMSNRCINGDASAILTCGPDTYDRFWRIQDVHILNNEFINCNDAIHTGKRTNLDPPKMVGDQQGLVIDGNHFHVDNRVYTDGNGRRDPKGNWAHTENAIDMKSGSENPDNPVVISNNIMWGYRRTDTKGGGSGSWGDAVVIHFGTWNVRILNNVIFDCARAIVVADKRDEPYAGGNIEVSDNILESIGDFWTIESEPLACLFAGTKDIRFTRNVMVANNQPVSTRWLALNGRYQNMTVSGNIIIGRFKMTGTRSSGTVVKDNLFYGCQPQEPGDGTVRGSVADARPTRLTFTTDRFSSHPREITIMVPGVEADNE